MSSSLFSSIPVSTPKRNFFDLSHDVKMTLDMGLLIPTMWMEVYPGDSISVGCTMQLRFMPLIAPVMHTINWYVHYFFVPYRVLWPNWQLYYQSPTDDSGTPAPVFPFMVADNLNTGPSTVYDYLGVPPIGISDATNAIALNAMPFAAYNKIYVDYYMDENLHGGSIPTWELVDGDNPAVHDVDWPFHRAWRKDYFTSALPFAQKGPVVTIPVGTLQDVRVFRNDVDPVTDVQNSLALTTPLVSQVTGAAGIPAEELYANTDDLILEASTINDWRRAVKLQEFLERMARGGSRPTEITRSVFGVTPPDYRLQRAEYINGARGRVIISEVLNTAGSFDAADPADPTSPVQGNMSGHGIAYGSGYNGKYFATEHGVLMGIMSVMPEPAYKDGINRSMLAKSDALEGLAWPQFGNLGEEPVKNVEVYADIPNTPQGETFGYQSRYAYLKYMPNRVAGSFRDSLAFWTLVRDFTSSGTSPVPLNQVFIECRPTKDIFAVIDPDQDSLLAHVFHSVKTKRCLPKFGVPSI